MAVVKVVVVAELGGQLQRLVEPEDADEDAVRGRVAAELEDVRGPEGGVGEVVAGDGDGVVEAVAVFVDWVGGC